MTCGKIAPRQWQMTGYYPSEGYLAECILKGRNHDIHVIKTPNGKFFAWEDDWECDCCDPNEEDRCTIHWEINEADIQVFQNKADLA